MFQDKMPLTDFTEEARGHIEQAEKGLLNMEQKEYNAETLNSVFRAVHSIKGTAGYFDLKKVVELSHSMENLLGELREKADKVSSEIVDALLRAMDVLGHMVNHPSSSEDVEIDDHVTYIKSFMSDMKDKENDLADAWDMLNSLFEEDEPLSTDISENTKKQEKLVTIPVEQPKQQEAKQEQIVEDSIKVSISVLNDLLTIASEMVLGRNQLLRIVENNHGNNNDLEMIAKKINNTTTLLQEKVMKARMQPIAHVFNKFPRMVREMSRTMEKEVELVLAGTAVELDKSIIEALVDPLTHLVRNAMDHGIEDAVTRGKTSKPFTGTLSLKAYQETGMVIIDITDDGRGLNIEKIKMKIIEKGLATELQLRSMNEQDVFAYIFCPGFSTAEKITNISGRGVGMDVVKTNIEKIGGKIKILSELGVGTTVRLLLPLTLAIISSIIVKCNDDCFAVPQANLGGCVLIQPEENNSQKIEFVHGQPVLRMGSRLLPIVRLSDILDLAVSIEDEGAYFAEKSRTFRILIIKGSSQLFGLAVDAVCDHEEILVKPMPHGLKSCQCFSGVTVLGDGKIAMILDTENVRIMAKINQLEDDISRHKEEKILTRSVNEEQQLLLFKASGSETLGLDIAMVSRVEEIEASCIEMIGDHEYIQFRGQSLRVIRPEQFLPINNCKKQLSKLYVIIPKLVKYPMGIIAEEIIDAVTKTLAMDSNGVSGKGVLGSTILNGKIVILINIYELFEQAAPEHYIQEKIGIKIIGQSKKTVLLAEDTPFFAKMAKGYLEWAGYEVLAAENGLEALEILEKNHIDIVVSDIEMPVMNGIELVRAIRASDQFKELPVIALTSLTRDDQKEKGLRAGFDRYEQKLDRTILLESVAAMLQKTES